MILKTQPTVIYTASKDETVTLNFWNLKKTENTYVLNGEETTLADCGCKIKEVHHVREIDLKRSEKITISSKEDNSIEVTIIMSLAETI